MPVTLDFYSGTEVSSNKTEQTVIKFIRDNNLLPEGKKYLLALSGGPDSVFLFHFLLKFLSKYNLEFAAAHLNHLLRGKNSDADMIFCEKLCTEHNITLFADAKDVKLYAEENKLSIEEAAREVRYQFLQKSASRFGADYILTAHNKGDNAETILYNVIRGTGLAGASGIPVKRDNIIRPLLSLSKNEILEYLHGYNHEYRTDETNFSSDYTRNYIRNELIPEIEKNINPGVEDALFRFGSIIGDAAAYIEQITENNVKKFVLFEEDIARVSDEIRVNGDFIFRAVMKFVIEDYFGEPFTYDDYLNLSGLSDNLTGKKNNLKNGLIACRERNEIVLKRYENPGDYHYKIYPGEEKIIFEAGIIIKLELVEGEKPPFSDDYELISANNIDDFFILRNWNFGDKFIPLGMKGFKKVSDFLNEQKIESFKKNTMPLLLNRNNIVSVIGLRIDDRFKVTDNDKIFCKIWVKHDDY